MADEYFRQYGVIAIFAALAVAVPTSMLLIGWVLSLLKVRPKKPSFVKNSIYECGFETITERWSQFNFRYYSIALLFVIFDVEVVFFIPMGSLLRDHVHNIWFICSWRNGSFHRHTGIRLDVCMEKRFT